MTREEAIHYGTSWADALIERGDSVYSDAVMFLYMAIEALSEPSKVDFRTDESAHIGTEVNDLISRADAIEAVESNKSDWNNDYNRPIEKDIQALKALPSADRPQGEWIHDGQNFKGGLDWCHCSECGHKTSTNGLSVYRYCPNCGARMEATK